MTRMSCNKGAGVSKRNRFWTKYPARAPTMPKMKSSSCGLPVLASADGIVIASRSSGWNGGYGQYVVVSHGNGTQSLYAHLNAIFTTVGQHVSQGVQIGTIGSTGNSTGCHVHFEIRGARNPF